MNTKIVIKVNHNRYIKNDKYYHHNDDNNNNNDNDNNDKIVIVVILNKGNINHKLSKNS